MGQYSKQIQQQALQSLRSGKIDDGIKLLNQAMALTPDSEDIHHLMGNALLQSGQREKAKEHFLTALKLAPAHLGALNSLGILSSGGENFAEAESYFLKALAIFPDHAATLNNIGKLYRHHDITSQAEDAFRRAAKADPASPGALINLGSLYLSMRRLADAETALRDALRVDPRNISALLNLSEALSRQARVEESLDCVRKIVDLHPERQDSYAHLAAALEMANRTAEAAEVIAQARQRFPDWPLSVTEIKLMRRAGNFDEAIRILDPRIGRLSRDNPLNFSAFSEMAKLYDMAGNSAKAFEYFTYCNECMMRLPDALRIDKDLLPSIVEHHVARYDAGWVKGWTETPSLTKSPEPVFIVGFPRSGTTLLNQILYCHPEIAVAEEIPALINAINYTTKFSPPPYPENLASLSPRQIEDLRTAYFDTHRQHGVDTGKKIVVDKHPLNMIHAGMIHRIFPGAKIILVLRHPCDCVLSCYMQTFVLNEANVNFLELGRAAEFYDKVFSAWERYRAVLPLNIHVVTYEQFVENPRAGMEKLVDFLGAQWVDDILAYDEKVRDRGVIRTASYSQVGEKINVRAASRWLRYREQLQPVLKTLLYWAEKHGYRD